MLLFRGPRVVRRGFPVRSCLGFSTRQVLRYSTTDSTTSNDEKKPAKNVRELMKTYGPVAIGIYGTVYIGTLGLMYELVYNNVIGVGDAISLLQSTGLDQYVDMTLIDKKTGDFALAWILTKFTEPIRLIGTLSITPPIARKMGWVKKTDEKENQPS